MLAQQKILVIASVVGHRCCHYSIIVILLGESEPSEFANPFANLPLRTPLCLLLLLLIFRYIVLQSYCRLHLLVDSVVILIEEIEFVQGCVD